MYEPVFSLTTLVRAIEILASIGILISTIEEIKNLKLYFNDGLYSWEFLSVRPRLKGSKIISNFYDFIFHDRAWYCIQIGCIISAILILTNVDLLKNVCIAYIMFYLLLFKTRNVYGFDGSDQLFQILFISLTLNNLFNASINSNFFLYFIAIQTSFAYFFSGFNKLKGTLWREGAALTLILTTQGFGNNKIHEFLAHNPTIARITNWAIIGFQLFFPTIFLLNTKFLFLTLLVGVFFHVSLGLIMGLNSFIWAFISTYPAIILLHQNLKNIL